MRPTLCLAILAVLSACSQKDATISSCHDLDDTGLTRDNADAYVAAWNGLPCTEELEGGDPGGWMDCRYGGDPGVCGQSSGLGVVGCWCGNAGVLECQNGVTVAQHQEEVSCPSGA